MVVAQLRPYLPSTQQTNVHVNIEGQVAGEK